MDNYIKQLQRFRWAIVIMVPMIVLILASNLKNISFEGSYRIWFGQDSAILKSYDDFRLIFGNDDAMIITFKDDNGIFNKKALNTIQTISDELWKTKYITRVDSIVSYQYVHTSDDDPDEILVEDFIQDIDTQTKEYFQKRKQIALNDPQLQGVFINKVGDTTMITARLTPKAGENEDISFELMELVHKIIDPISKDTNYTFHLNGGAAITTSFINIAQADGGTFTPLVIFSVMVLLFVLFRKISASLIPMFIVILTMLVVLSIQVLLGYKLNNFTANIPVFIIAIGIADAVHIYIVWLIYRKQGMQNIKAVEQTLKKNMIPIFLTSLTTTIGFGSLSISEVVPVATLGIATATGAMLAFVLSITMIPALLLIIGNNIKQDNNINLQTQDEVIENRYMKISDFVIKHNKKIVFITLSLFTIFAIGIFKVKVDSNTIRYFDKDAKIRQSTEFQMNNLTGPMAYEIIINSNQKDGIKDPEFMKTVQRFYDDYQDKFSDVRDLSSLIDVVKQFHKVMNGDKQEFYTIPDTKELIAQYLLFYSMSLPQGMQINDKMDTEEKILRVTAQINLVDTSKDIQMIHFAQDWWKDTKYSAVVVGQTSMFARMQKDVTNTLIYSISIALVLVSIMMLIIFKNIKMLVIFLLPNILPIALIVGIMGWLDINIDLGVAIAGAIILGVAVDDSIHFFYKYFDAKKKGYDMRTTLAYVYKYSGTAILFTTIILSSSFLIFLGSDFSPNYNFGIVTSIALVIALVADLLLLPALLSLKVVNK
jgi:predicted RND superfamily exporter protein